MKRGFFKSAWDQQAARLYTDWGRKRKRKYIPVLLCFLEITAFTVEVSRWLFYPKQKVWWWTEFWMNDQQQVQQLYCMFWQVTHIFPLCSNIWQKKLCLKGRLNLRAARYPLHPSGKTHVKGTLLLGNCQVVDVAKDFTWLFFQRISKDFFAWMSPKTHRLPFLWFLFPLH